MVRRIVLRAAANGGHADAVGVSEVHLGSRHGSAILHLHQRHPVLPPDFTKGISLGKQGVQPVAVARHRLRADGVQRHQDVIVSSSKALDPVLGRAGSGIADQLCSLRSPLDECTERLERERREAFLYLQRYQSGPRDTDVEAIVGLATWGIGRIVPRPGREPYVPVLRSRDLRGVGFIAAYEPAELPARVCRTSYRQQEVPHQRHPVSPENESLNVRKVERRLFRDPRTALSVWRLMSSTKEPTKKPRALLRRCCLCVVLLCQRRNSG